MKVSGRFIAAVLLSVVLVFTYSCSTDDPLPENPDQLDNFLAANQDIPLIRDSLIACAFGGQTGIFDNADFPVGVLFYPEGNATNFQYFETKDANVNPDDYSNYCRVELADEPFFNGYLRRFLRPDLTIQRYGLVLYQRGDKFYISNPINLKTLDTPTEYNPNLLEIDQTDPFSPKFRWTDGRIAGNVIYFHAVLDEQGDLVSGTYTLDKQFQFYDLSNVVLNIRDVTPPPSLASGKSYRFVLMGVSIDNWVNLFADVEFRVD
ncbi:MAG: hypothetical protein AAGC85_10085 [Bacteroidota bacterium]